MDSFYENIGGKLKGWAKFIFVAEAIGAIIGGINLLGNDAVVAGLLLLFFGPIAALISTWLLYAFGELVEKTAANEENIAEVNKLINPAMESVYFRSDNVAVSSSMVKELHSFGLDVSPYLPKAVYDILQDK